MEQFIKFVGLDVHGKTIAAAVADSRSSEVRFIGQIANTPEAITKLVGQLNKDGAALSFCYEAGPCGYGIHRQLTSLKHRCQVIAPSLIPKKVGDRVKTDRRDSLMLARLHRAGELTAVWIPDGEHEALRDLTRARGDMKDLERRARQQLLALLLRQGRRHEGKSNWTQAHFRWLETVKFAHPTQQIVMQEYIDTVVSLGKRVAALKTRTLQKRAEQCDEKVQAIAWDAQKRLCHRYRHLTDGGKLKVQVVTAVARELAGFIWAIGQAVPAPTAKVNTRQ